MENELHLSQVDVAISLKRMGFSLSITADSGATWSSGLVLRKRNATAALTPLLDAAAALTPPLDAAVSWPDEPFGLTLDTPRVSDNLNNIKKGY
ncbi:hypothetical protein MY3296_001538 [Beauveria thailandica]